MRGYDCALLCFRGPWRSAWRSAGDVCPAPLAPQLLQMLFQKGDVDVNDAAVSRDIEELEGERIGQHHVPATDGQTPVWRPKSHMTGGPQGCARSERGTARPLSVAAAILTATAAALTHANTTHTASASPRPPAFCLCQLKANPTPMVLLFRLNGNVPQGPSGPGY